MIVLFLLHNLNLNSQIFEFLQKIMIFFTHFFFWCPCFNLKDIAKVEMEYKYEDLTKAFENFGNSYYIFLLSLFVCLIL